MFGWFRKKPEIEPIERNGLFSTDVSFKSNGKRPSLDALLSMSIKRTVDDMQIVDGSGVAMDSVDAPQSPKPYADFEGIPNLQLQWYAAQGFIGHQVCAILSQNWFVNKACRMPAKDAIRHGYEITANDGQDIAADVLSFIKKRDKKFKIKKHCREFVGLGNVFGIRIALFNYTGIDYEAPFNIDGIRPGSYTGISQVDPYWIVPQLDAVSSSDPSSPNFYEPAYWQINGKRIHRSHLIIYRTDEVPDILKPTYLYGGLPLPQLLAERLYAAERTANEAPMLSLSKRTTVVKLDVKKALANYPKFQEMMEFWTSTRDNYGVKVVGIDDDLQQFDTALAEFTDLIMNQFTLACAIGEVQVTKMMGVSPTGLGSTGQHDSDNYHEKLESIQENDMDPLVERHHLLLMKSEITPKFSVNFEIVASWNAVDSPTAEEQAALNLVKAQTDVALSQTGGIDGETVRARIIADKDSGYNGLEDDMPDEMDDPNFVPETNRRETMRTGDDAGGEQP